MPFYAGKVVFRTHRLHKIHPLDLSFTLNPTPLTSVQALKKLIVKLRNGEYKTKIDKLWFRLSKLFEAM